MKKDYKIYECEIAEAKEIVREIILDYIEDYTTEEIHKILKKEFSEYEPGELKSGAAEIIGAGYDKTTACYYVVLGKGFYHLSATWGPTGGSPEEWGYENEEDFDIEI